MVEMIARGMQTVKGSRGEGVGPRAGGLAAVFLAAGLVIGAATGCGTATQPASTVAHAGPSQVASAHDHGPAADGHAHGHDDHAHAGPAAGAGQTTPAVDASQPTFRDALAAIIDHDERIRAAFEANDPDAAHDDLHAIGHLLEDLPKLAGTAGVALDRKAVERSAGVLFAAFSRIDDKLHGGTGSTYAEEAKTISKELGAFRAFLAEHRP
ncbi:MAG: hypothetical protein ACKO9B_17440 [Planctomycetota bacterium]|nr:hypothetical protein [Planctomycetota bacterium]